MKGKTIMRIEEISTVYTAMKDFIKHEIFKQKLELILLSEEFQVTYSPEDSSHSRPMEHFHIINILVKTDDDEYYKIQAQKDRSDICHWDTIQQFVVKKVNSIDVRNIGGFEIEDYFGNTRQVFYTYYCPKGRGKHYVSIGKGDDCTIIGDGYFEISVSKNGMYLSTKNSLIEKINGRKLRSKDLEQMANDRGLEYTFIPNFVL